MGQRFSVSLHMDKKHGASRAAKSLINAASPDCILLKIGIISDIQAADIDDGKSFHGANRYYRHAFEILNRAVLSWQQQKISMAIHLGDLIDGFQPKVRLTSTVAPTALKHIH